MALLYIDSFDHYDAAHILSKWTSGFTLAGIAIGQGRCGTNCMSLGTFNGMTKGLTFGSTTSTVGFAMKVIPFPSGISPVGLVGSDGFPHLSLSYFPSDGSLGVYARRHSFNPDPSEKGRTEPDVIRQGVWYYIELQTTIDSTAGVVILRVNGTEVINVTGVNTVGDSGGGPPMTADLRSVYFSCPSNAAWYMDDLYILDDTGAAPWNTFLGDVRVEYLRPRANGTYQSWDLVGAASHYDAVDDAATPNDDTDYLHTTVNGEMETQLHRPTGLPAGGIVYGAQLSLLARKTDTGPRSLAPVIRLASTDEIGLSQEPSHVSYRYLHQIYQVHPVTGVAWTIDDVNDSEYGVMVTE